MRTFTLQIIMTELIAIPLHLHRTIHFLAKLVNKHYSKLG